MSGIIFLGTQNLELIREFYLTRIGAELWLEQADCIVLKHGNLLLGFCRREKCERGGIITFFYPTTREVDDKYREFSERAQDPPQAPMENRKYSIYHFFSEDPEGRVIEFQAFLHPVAPFMDGYDLMSTRRSVREFEDDDVPENVLLSVFESCRFAPTSCNSESYYFIVLRNREVIEFISNRRGSSSAPIAQSPIAVAICSDPGKTRRPIQDGCIGAYHFLLSCWNHGLGTCWIAAMDREDVKEVLGIPQDHYVATVTPVGYPGKVPHPPRRRAATEMIRYLD